MGAGGLVIDMRAKGRQPEIQDVELDGVTSSDGSPADLLRVRFKTRTRLIRLPIGSLPVVANCESSYKYDKLVISADNYLFGASPDGPYRMKGSVASKHESAAEKLVVEQARELGISDQFALALLHYDAYADGVVCGVVPADAQGAHPLAMDRHPGRVIANILNDPKQGAAFRQIFRSFSMPPTCVAQLFLSYEGSVDETPRVVIRARRWFMGYRWDQEVVVLNESEQPIVDWLYVQLGNDIENRWGEYQRVFRPLGELSSIIEALAILRTLRDANPHLYLQLKRKIANRHGPSWNGPMVNSAQQKSAIMANDDWRKRLLAQVGMYVQTESDANIVLSLEMYRWEYENVVHQADDKIDYPITWEAGLDRFARKGGNLTATKILFVRALWAKPSESLRLFVDFFNAVRSQVPGSFGLWLQSLNWLREYCNRVYPNLSGEHQKLLEQEQEEVLLAVNERIGQIIKEAANEPAVARKFLGIAFGTRLFDLATVKWSSHDSDGKLDSPKLARHVEDMAQIHLLSVGDMDVRKSDRTLLLAHHRYLGYLADKVPGAASKIEIVRKEILRRLDLAY